MAILGRRPRDDEGTAGHGGGVLDAAGRLTLPPGEAGAAVRRVLRDGDAPAARELSARVATALLDDLPGLAAYVAALDGSSEPEVLDTRPLLEPAFACLAARGTGYCTRFLAAVRDSGHPALAVLALHAYGRSDGVDLTALAGDLGSPADRMILLTAASLNRSPEDAARLAVGNEDAEGDVASVIVHDVALQRTVPEVARFVRALHAREAFGLAAETVERFAEADSDRSNLDKAILYVSLDAGDRLGPLAADLLRHALTGLEDRPRLPVPGDQDDLVAAFWQLCPGHRVLETWYAERLSGSEHSAAERKQVAYLLRSSDGAGRDSLLAALAEHAWAHHLVRIYELLTDGRHGTEAGRLVRALAATGHLRQIGDFLKLWSERHHPARDTAALLKRLLAPRPDGTPSLRATTIAGLQEYLPDGLGDELRREALAQPGGRSGDDVVHLLDTVPDGMLRGRVRAAERVGRQLAHEVVATPAVPRERLDWYAGCLAALVRGGHAAAARTSWKELADAAGTHAEAAWVVAGAAHRMLRAASSGDDVVREALTAGADELLTSYLYHSQSIEPDDVVAVTTRLRLVHEPRYPAARRRAVLEESVGRWTDRGRRDVVVEKLLDAGQEQEADWIRSVRD